MSNEDEKLQIDKRLLELEEWRCEFDRRKHIDTVNGLSRSDSFKAIIAYSLAAIRGSFLLNGGGAVALLAFMSDSKKAQCVDLSDPLMLFVFGAVLAVLSSGVSYIGQTFFTFEIDYRWSYIVEKDTEKENKQRANRVGGLVCQAVGSVLVAISIICFWEGIHQAYDIFKAAPVSC